MLSFLSNQKSSRESKHLSCFYSTSNYKRNQKRKPIWFHHCVCDIENIVKSHKLCHNFACNSRIKINSNKNKSPIILMYSREDFINKSAVLPVPSAIIKLPWVRPIKVKSSDATSPIRKTSSVSDVIRRPKRTKRRHSITTTISEFLIYSPKRAIISFLYRLHSTQTFPSCQIVLPVGDAKRYSDVRGVTMKRNHYAYRHP